jgi:Lon protease-like protein
MFPLMYPLVPHAGVPLHIFEERYRSLVHDCLAGDRRFGVVMIERGPEVGGGDTRVSTGTVAQIAQAEELPDGRWMLIAFGVHRLRVVEWLPDDPYPRARIEELPEPEAEAGGADRDDLERTVRRIAALQAELAVPAAPIDIELAADPVAAGYQAAVAVGLGPLDVQHLLEIDDPDERLAAVAASLDETERMLHLQLQGEDDTTPRSGM